jgi:hypothetical protein
MIWSIKSMEPVVVPADLPAVAGGGSIAKQDLKREDGTVDGNISGAKRVVVVHFC